MAMPPARAIQGFLILLVFQRPSESSQARFAYAPVLRRRVFGLIELKQLKTRLLSTYPYYLYRWLRDLRLPIYDFRH